MSVIVRCPACSTQLRVGEELIGKKVRCPSCSTVFTAPAAEVPAPVVPPESGSAAPEPWRQIDLELDDPASSAPSGPRETNRSSAPSEPPTEKIEPWQSIQLSLDEPSPPPSVPASPERSNRLPVEDREELPLPGREPSHAPEPEPEETGRRRARLLDDHEDMTQCPTCGKMVYRDASRCSWCNERLRGTTRRTRYDDYDEEDDGPSHRRVYRRRDWEPDRGNTILTLGILSIVAPFASCLVGIAWIAGLPMGIIAWMMGSTDLDKMKRGIMDPGGESSTRQGYICGIIGTVLNGLFMLLCVGYISFIVVMISQEEARRNQRNMNPPVLKR